MRSIFWSAVLIILVLAGLIPGGTMPLAVMGQEGSSLGGVIVSAPVKPKLSPELSSLPQSIPESKSLPKEIDSSTNPLPGSDQGVSGTGTDHPAARTSVGVSSGTTPSPTLNFAGQSSPDSVAPSESNGDVGPNHYVQVVNIHMAVYDKSNQTLLGSWPTNALWTGFGGPCESCNDGMAVALYDDMAGRWLISQIAYQSGQTQCVAISTTSNPLGSYNLYAFTMTAFPDYPKFGIWSDGYYFGTNTGSPNQFYAHVLDRSSMLAGNLATVQSFGGYPNFLMPADADGKTPPPTASPEYFYTFLDDEYSGHPADGVDRLAVYEFDVDWTTPANSTFTLVTELPISDFEYTVCGYFVQDCIPQPATTKKIDSGSYWPMPRLQYRNFGSHESMVGNFTVDLDGTDKAAIRWFELRRTGSNPWTLYQEGTFAPDSDHRFMGSIAMDSRGNIALEYTVSSSTTMPSIRYAVRTPDDPLGTLRAEASLIEGTGVQTATNRWGGSSAINVDPVDNCTFWMTNQYNEVTNTGFSWKTRIGTFMVPGCTDKIEEEFPWTLFLPSMIRRH